VVVSAHIRQHRLGGRAGCADAQQRGLLPLALGQGHDLVHVAGDHPDLVEDRESRVEPFEAFGFRRETHERRAPLGHDQPIPEHLHAARQILRQLHHPGGSGEHDPGLPLVGRGHHDRRTLVTEHQIEETERGDQCGLTLPSRHHPARETRTRIRVEDGGHQLDLPTAQPHRLPRPGALRNHHEPLTEPREPSRTHRARPERQHRRVDRSLRTRLHAASPP